MAKRFLMTQLWRIQQSYTLLSLFLWGIVIAFTAFPIVSPVWFPFLARFGIPATAPGVVALTLILLFFLIYGSVYAFGFVYDRYLRLWREQLDVAMEKNPYAREKLAPKEILMWRHIYLPTMKAVGRGSRDYEEDISFVERWIETSLAGDGSIRASVEEAERWIRSGIKAK
jgi:hypothetical protein